MLALALPGAGCSTFSYIGHSGASAAEQAPKQAVLPFSGVPGSEAEVTVFLAQAQQARADGDLTTAAKLLSQLVLIAPDDQRVLGAYGKVLAAQGRSDDALAFLERAIQLQPGDWTLYSAQGVAYDQQAKYPLAQASYAHALELKPGEPAVLNNDALSHMQAGDLTGAANLLRQVSPQSPNYDHIAKTLALLEQMIPSAPPAPVIAELARRTAATENGMPQPVAIDAPITPTMMSSDVALVMEQQEPAALPILALQPEQPMPVVIAPAVVAKPALNAYDALKADPTVVMAPIPVDDPAPQPVKPRVVASLSAEHAPQPSPAKPPVAAPQPVEHPSNQPRTQTGARLYVQAGAYLSDTRAHQAAAGLESMNVKIMQATVNGRDLFRVRIGPFSTMSEARNAFAGAQALGRSDLFITQE